MKNFKKIKLLAVMIIALFTLTVFSLADDSGIIPIYSGSDIRYDDKIGYEEYSFIIDEQTVQKEEGVLRRIFCRAPEGRSSLEIIKNYEAAIKKMGGEVLFLTRTPKDIDIDGAKLSEIFGQNRTERGLSTYHYTHTEFPKIMTEYLTGRVRDKDKDVYIIVAVGPGAWAASEHTRVFYELVTLEVKAMEMDMITAAAIGEGLASRGSIAIYNIFFDTGKSDVKAESADALKAVAEYLNSHQNKKVLVVGHTDKTGDFDMNVKLSRDRAAAVIKKLTDEYGIDEERLKPYGVGPVCPVMSNSTEEGRAKNRRVEIVER